MDASKNGNNQNDKATRREAFGTALSTCLAAAEITQKEIAEEIKKSQSTISKLITGDVKVALPTVEELNNLEQFIQKRWKQLDIENKRQGLNSPKDINPCLKKMREKYAAASSRPIEDITARLVSNALSGPETSEIHQGLKKDIEKLVWLWGGYYQNKTKFSKGEMHFEDAERNYNDLLAELQGKLGASLKMHLLFERARQRRFLGELPGAIADYHNALRIAEQLDAEKMTLALLLGLGDLRRRQDKEAWEKAMEHYENAKKVASGKLDDKQKQADVDRKIASVWLFAGEPKEAEAFCENSLDAARQGHFRNTERKAMQHQAWAFEMMGKMEDAIELQKKAVEIVEEIQDQFDNPKKEFAKSYRFLGDTYRRCGYFEKALENYEKAQQNASQAMKVEKGKDNEDRELLIRGMILLGIGSVFLHQPENRSAALAALKESRRIHRDLGQTFAIGLSNLRLGELYLLDKEYNLARDFFTVAQGNFLLAGFNEKYGNPYYSADLQVSLARLALETGENTERAIDHTEEAIRLSKEYHFPKHEMRAHFWKAKALLPNAKKAMRELEEALVIALETSPCLLDEHLKAIEKHVLNVEPQFAEEMIERWPLFAEKYVQTTERLEEWLEKIGREWEIDKVLA